MSRLPGVIAGSLTGMALGAAVVVIVCSWVERQGWVRFSKEPVVLVAVGIPVGGFLGGLVGLWSVTTKAERRDPDDPA